MASTTDIRISVDFFEHHKTLDLECRLGFMAVKSLMLLWIWTAKNRPDGNLAGISDKVITAAAKWNGEDDFVQTLVELGWIDGTPGHRELHGWLENNPWAVGAEKRENVGRFKALKSKLWGKAFAAELEQYGVCELTKEEYERIRLELSIEFLIGDKLPVASAENNVARSNADSAANASASDNTDNAANTTANAQGVASANAFAPVPIPIPRDKGIRDLKHDDTTCHSEQHSPPRPKNEHGEEVDDVTGKEKVTFRSLMRHWNVIMGPRGFPKCRDTSSKRERHVKARVKEGANDRRDIAWWTHKVFETVARSDFLSGNTEQRNGRKPFVCTLDWIIQSEDNLLKIMEGRYDNSSWGQFVPCDGQ